MSGLAGLLFPEVNAQVEIDQRIDLTGSGSNAKIQGIEEVVNDHDAVNKIYVDTLVANATSGSSSNLIYTVVPGASSVTFASNACNSSLVLAVKKVSGTPSPVTMEITGLPAGVSYELLPGGGYPNFNATVNLCGSESASPGTYQFTVTSTGGSSAPQVYTIDLILSVPIAKRVFVTSTTYQGNLGGVGGANTKCQDRATAAGLSGTYLAYISTTSPVFNAINNVPNLSSGQYFGRLDDVPVANGRADLLDGTLMNPISVNEFGAEVTGSPMEVWTNTKTDGTNSAINVDCTVWTSTAAGGAGGNGWHGQLNHTTSTWTDNNWNACQNYKRLYCFEQ